MITTFEIAHPYSLGYESTQTRTPSKTQRFVRNAREHALGVLGFLTCSRIVIAELDEVVEEINVLVECDVEDLATEIKIVNAHLLEVRDGPMVPAAIEVSIREVAIAAAEGIGMLAEDRDVATIQVPFNLVEPEILAIVDQHMAQVDEWVRIGIEQFADGFNERDFRARRQRAFEQEVGRSYDELLVVEEAYQNAIADLHQPVILPDGSVGLIRRQAMRLVDQLARRGEESVVPGWTRTQHDALVAQKAGRLTPRKIYPRLVAAFVQDSRARWGLLPDTQANRLIVGHNMRKQCRNGALRTSVVDTNVALALNSFFVPQAGDLLARGQSLHHSATRKWRDYDLQGSSWWQRLVYTGHSAATPVV